jgi:hypothetical protein
MDLVSLDGQPGVLAIQACADNGGAVAERVRKIEAAPICGPWLRAGNRIEVWGWGKRGAAGKRKVWTLRVIAISLSPAAL